MNKAHRYYWVKVYGIMTIGIRNVLKLHVTTKHEFMASITTKTIFYLAENFPAQFYKSIKLINNEYI